METKKIIREATQAGRFYEQNPDLLRQDVDSLLSVHEGSDTFENVAAIIAPHAGYYYSGNVAASAYMAIAPNKRYKRVFLLGPSHQTWLDGASADSGNDCYATPLGQVDVDLATARELNSHSDVFAYKAKAHAGEHCLEVQLPFLQLRM